MTGPFLGQPQPRTVNPKVKKMVYHKVSYAWPTRKPITKLLALTLTSSVKVPSPFTEPNLTTKIAKPNLPNRISQTKLTKSNLPNYTNQIKPRKVELWIVDWVGTIKTAKELYPSPFKMTHCPKFFFGQGSPPSLRQNPKEQQLFFLKPSLTQSRKAPLQKRIYH